MSDQPQPRQPRVLIIDDNAAIHQDFRKILSGQTSANPQLDNLEKELFGSPTDNTVRAAFRIDSALQGQDGLAMLERALAENDPYVLAFVDIRMPPGWDGIETLGHLWRRSPELQAVLCTAYSDYTWDDIAQRLGQRDSLLILKKPFDTAEVLQTAHALTRKWELARQAQLRLQDLERMVSERTQKLQLEIEERTRIQEALRVSEERFSKAFQCCPIAMSIQSHPEGRFLDANPAFLALTGYSRIQLLRESGAALSLWEESLDSQADKNRRDLRIRNRPNVLRRCDSSLRNTMVWAEPITLQSGLCLLVIVEDVTEHMRMEVQLRQSQKLEAVGCLAAGVAHEFNNLLTVIQGHTGLLKSKIAESGAAAESVDRIAQASERAASLTRRLLAFSHKQPLQLKEVDLSRLVQGVGKTLSQLIGERFQVQLECASNLPPTRADEGNLEQILINLALNARDAMPNGGTLRIATGLLSLAEATACKNFAAQQGRHVCLIVTDTGCGMTREVMSRIFDPFYTTKEIGKGTGLGLSTVHGIVKQHNGWIDVASEVDCGTTFKVFLPVWEGISNSNDEVEEAKSESSTRLGAGETVLIVEDEGIVREAARLALERAGYNVLEAADGPSALTIWDRSKVRIDLLVTDMVMPHGVSGGALARLLKARDPQLRALYTSGYSSDVVKEDQVLTFGNDFLRKPYNPASLLQAVRSCLNSDPASAQQTAGNASATSTASLSAS